MDKPNYEIEPDSPEINEPLNGVLVTALVDSWQTKRDPLHTQGHDETEHQSTEDERQVFLTATVKERFVNTVVMRTGEPAYVPLTTNVGLKYKRRML